MWPLSCLWQGKHYHVHLKVEKSESQRGYVNCLTSHSIQRGLLGSEPRSLWHTFKCHVFHISFSLYLCVVQLDAGRQGYMQRRRTLCPAMRNAQKAGCARGAPEHVINGQFSQTMKQGFREKRFQVPPGSQKVRHQRHSKLRLESRWGEEIHRGGVRRLKIACPCCSDLTPHGRVLRVLTMQVLISPSVKALPSATPWGLSTHRMQAPCLGLERRGQWDKVPALRSSYSLINANSQASQSPKPVVPAGRPRGWVECALCP